MGIDLAKRIILFILSLIFTILLLSAAHSLPSYETPLEQYKDTGCASFIPRSLYAQSLFVGNYKVDIISLNNDSEFWREHCDDHALVIRDMRTMWDTCNIKDGPKNSCGGIVYSEFGRFGIIKNKVINKEYIFISSEHDGLRGWYLGDEYPIAELPINVGIKCRLVSADIENKIRCYEPSSEIDFLKIKCGHSMWGYWMHDTVTYEFDYTDVTRTVVEKADLSQMPEACKY